MIKAVEVLLQPYSYILGDEENRINRFSIEWGITHENYDILSLNPFEPSSGLVVLNIDGLDPIRASVNSSEIGSADGNQYNSTRFPARNILITLALYPSPTMEDTRQTLYRYFRLRTQSIFGFETELRKYYIGGRVESVEVNIFSKMVTASISIICTGPDPFFIGEHIDHFFECDPGEFETINYVGTAPSGFTLNVTVKEASNYLGVDWDGGAFYFLDVEGSGGYQDNDEIVLVTHRGYKSVQLLRNSGNPYWNMLNYMVFNSGGWPILDVTYPNRIRAYVNPNSAIDTIRIRYDNLYDGIV